MRFSPFLFPLFASAIVMAQSVGAFTATGNMITPRVQHTATLLVDGRVLIIGGATSDGVSLASAELYDPSTGTFAATGNMTTGRGLHVATLLPDGRVLVTGGLGGLASSSPTASAELYDPSTGTFSAINNMNQARGWHTATLLDNGTILIAGELHPSDGQKPLSDTADIYDPTTGTFNATGPYAGTDTISVDTATLLSDGSVLLIANSPGPFVGPAERTEVFDPGSGSFSLSTSDMRIWPGHTATLLTNGKILVAGGGSGDFGAYANAELYDPSTGIFNAGDMGTARGNHTATLLPDGTVLIAGGNGYSSLSSAEVCDPFMGTFIATGDLTGVRTLHTATLLNSGKILIAGGFTGEPTPSSRAELYNPPVLSPAPMLFSLLGDGQGQGAVWQALTGSIASPSSPANAGDILSLYTTSLVNGGVIPPQVAIGGRLAEILFFGPAPGYPGYNQVNFRVPRGVVSGAVVPVRLSYLGRATNEVTIGVQ